MLFVSILPDCRPSTEDCRLSVDHLALGDLVRRLQMRNLQPPDGFDRHGNCLIGVALAAERLQTASSRPQGAQYLRPIKPLTFTVIAEAHVPILSDDGRQLTDD